MRWNRAIGMAQAAALIMTGMGGLGAAEPEPAPAPLKVMTWNLHHGVGEDDKLDLERIAAVIREQKPDLVALQEIDRGCKRTKGVDQAAELGRLTGLHVAFGKAMDFDGGQYGQAILSRVAIGETRVIPLPGEGEPRIGFEAAVTIGGRKVKMVTVHLDHQQPERRMKQVEALALAYREETGAMIVAGDMNDTPGSPAYGVLQKTWVVADKKEPVVTCPAAKPKVEIDHIFLRGFRKTAPATVLPEAVASDHRPVVVEVE